MAASGFPPIPHALLEALERAFPEQSVLNADQTHAHLLFEGGKREVVRFIRARYREQQVADSTELPNVLVQP